MYVLNLINSLLRDNIYVFLSSCILITVSFLIIREGILRYKKFKTILLGVIAMTLGLVLCFVSKKVFICESIFISANIFLCFNIFIRYKLEQIYVMTVNIMSFMTLNTCYVLTMYLLK